MKTLPSDISLRRCSSCSLKGMGVSNWISFMGLADVRGFWLLKDTQGTTSTLVGVINRGVSFGVFSARSFFENSSPLIEAGLGSFLGDSFRILSWSYSYFKDFCSLWALSLLSSSRQSLLSSSSRHLSFLSYSSLKYLALSCSFFFSVSFLAMKVSSALASIRSRLFSSLSTSSRLKINSMMNF